MGTLMASSMETLKATLMAIFWAVERRCADMVSAKRFHRSCKFLLPHLFNSFNTAND